MHLQSQPPLCPGARPLFGHGSVVAGEKSTLRPGLLLAPSLGLESAKEPLLGLAEPKPCWGLLGQGVVSTEDAGHCP